MPKNQIIWERVIKRVEMWYGWWYCSGIKSLRKELRMKDIGTRKKESFNINK